ncbi:MAG TPA: B12-binding domain-containing radical SAM protein [Elusimicrobia bacterium]|nr:B12-binding domain-containing radical SAM protein [Elusimicrobiota bacterium]
MKILLINPPWMTKGGIWENIASCMPPFGLAGLAAYLEEKKIEVEILDSNATGLNYNNIKEILGSKAVPDYIGITASTPMIYSAIDVSKIAKSVFPSAKTVLGGVHPSVMTDEVLKEESIDFVIRGEGEETLNELISGKEIAKISGLSYKIGNKIIHNQSRPVVQDMDTLPIPAYHLLPIKKYFPAKGSYKRLPAMGMMTSRGCPGRCTFCMGNYLGDKIRVRSAEKIFEEILLLHNKYGIKEISFYDDTFTTRKENVKKLCEKIISEKLDISWSCFARVDFVDEDLLKIMKLAGCHQIMYGVESGDEEILKNIHKKISFEKVEKIVKITKKLGIEVRAAFMFGNPGETIETMQKTIDYAIKLKPDVVIFNITTPYPGTEMFKWAKEKGILITENWNEYDLSKPIMNLPTVKPEDVIKYYNKAYKDFYIRPGYLLNRVLKIRNLSDVIDGVSALLGIARN